MLIYYLASELPRNFPESRIEQRPRAGSGVVRIDPLRFLAGCPVVKVRGPGGSASLLRFEPRCNSMSAPDWIDKVLFYAQITPNYLGVEWVLGLLQPGFVRWGPCFTWPLWPLQMSYKATKPGLVCVLYLSMLYTVLLFIRAPFIYC